MKKNQSPTKFQRFEKTEILLHWSHGIPFIILLLTGIFLVIQGWQGAERSSSVNFYHKVFGIVLIFLPFVVILSGNFGLIIKNLKKILSFNENDKSWLAAQMSKEEPLPQGKFNPGQKLNTIAVMGYSSLLQLTGIWLWLSPHSMLPRWLHTLLAFIGAFLLMGHLYMAMLNPSTRKAFKAVFTGLVDKEYIKHHHPLQLTEEELDED